MRISIYFVLLSFLLFSCEDDFLDRKLDTNLHEDEVFINYSRIRNFGNGVFSYVPVGFNRIGGSFFSGITDDAEHTWQSSSVHRFNIGAITSYYNPDNQWAHYYEGIRRANKFLENTVGFEDIIVRDTVTANGKAQYLQQVEDIHWMQQEVRFLRAWFHFELVKRYGGVPIVTSVLSMDEELDLPQDSFDECINFIVDECDAVADTVRTEWVGFKDDEAGRVTKGTVLALKSRVLLYAASPLHNLNNDVSKWEDAAAAAYDVIAMGKYSLHDDYGSLFRSPQSYRSNEVIFSRRDGSSNSIERENYPIGTEGGQSGTCPSQNLVNAYEKLDGWDPFNPYELVDPRLQMTIVVNNSTWNSRTIESWIGGQDGKGQNRASRTGYYLKKYLTDNLNLTQDQESIHSWIIFRYAEILLNYAEAMNEAYGPTADPQGYGMTALDAINQIRQRPGVGIPVIEEGISQTDLREKIKNERRVELAYEEHRYWDLLRWKDATEVLNEPLRGVEITKDGDNFTYDYVEVEPRHFDEKMYLYPIPQEEVLKSDGNLTQNPGW
jgi:hypothetical protein